MNTEPVAEIGAPMDVTADDVVEQAEGPISFRRRLCRWGWHFWGRQITLWSLIAIRVAGWIGRKRRPIGPDGCEIMLTGRFDSANWILAHLGPLSASVECKRLYMVSTSPVPDLPKVVALYPSKWLIRVLGATAARLLTFGWAAIRKRPHCVGGFHLSFNGIVATIAARLTGARSIYFCVGGPPEVSDGGAYSENAVLARMETADAVVERRLLEFVAKNDLVVTMGSRAVRYFRDKGVDTCFHVVSGGIDPRRFQPSEERPSYDLILTGRLAHVKRIDVFLRAVKHVVEQIPTVKAAIVGDGELREELERLSIGSGVADNVVFGGRRDDIPEWLRRAKVFVLTSDSEGLSLSMMEAMMSGLPAVVSDVGDLADLVEDGVNGYLVPRRSPELLADRLVELLSDEAKLASFSQAARRSALRYETQAAIEQWNGILAGFRTA